MLGSKYCPLVPKGFYFALECQVPPVLSELVDIKPKLLHQADNGYSGRKTGR